jgi:hypothetical protein
LLLIAAYHMARTIFERFCTSMHIMQQAYASHLRITKLS